MDLEAQFEHFPGTFGFAADPIGMGSTIQDFANIDFQDASHSNGGMSADHVYIAVCRICHCFSEAVETET